MIPRRVFLSLWNHDSRVGQSFRGLEAQHGPSAGMSFHLVPDSGTCMVSIKLPQREKPKEMHFKVQLLEPRDIWWWGLGKGLGA